MKQVFVATILGLAGVIVPRAFCRPKPTISLYAKAVAEIHAKQKGIPHSPMYIAGAVKKPGAYQFKGPVTIAEFVKAAGGFSFAESTAPVRGWISAYHPTKERPDPWEPAIQCNLNVKNPPNMDVDYCTNRVSTNDLVFVGLQNDFKFVLP